MTRSVHRFYPSIQIWKRQGKLTYVQTIFDIKQLNFASSFSFIHFYLYFSQIIISVTKGAETAFY